MSGEVEAQERGHGSIVDENVDVSSAECHDALPQPWAQVGPQFPYCSRAEGVYQQVDDAETEGAEGLVKLLALMANVINPLKGGIGSAATDGIVGSVAATLVKKGEKPDKATSAAPATTKARPGRKPVFSNEDWIKILVHFKAIGRNYKELLQDIVKGRLALSDKSVINHSDLQTVLRRPALLKREKWLEAKQTGTRVPPAVADEKNPPPSSTAMDYGEWQKEYAKWLKANGQ